MSNLERRDFIKKSVIGGLGGMLLTTSDQRPAEDKKIGNPKSHSFANPGVVKKIVIAGGGISGLCCAYELMKKGHEVIVLEAAGRYGGTVLSVNDGLADGLYADFGAENFTKPGYENYWKYIKEFNLPVIQYFHREGRLTRVDGKWYNSESMLQMRADEARKLGGYTDRELKFLATYPSSSLEVLFLQPYFAKFTNEYQPFGIGYDELENIPVSEIYKKEGASQAALNMLGGKNSSALYNIWQAYIMDKRGYGVGYDLFRLKGGNQIMTNEFSKRLGSRLRLDCKVMGIEHGQKGATIKYKEGGEDKTISADYVVCCLRTPVMQNISITPKLPEEKRFVVDNLTYEQTTRIVFQAKSPFWLEDNTSINLTFNHPALRTIWRVAEEVDTQRVALMAKAPGGTNPMRALEAFKELYPGKKSSINIEQILVKDWAADSYAHGCERFGFSALGGLSKYWPHTMTPLSKMIRQIEAAHYDTIWKNSFCRRAYGQ
ncbi:MAG: FAD-dependent oxidoreductase [Flavitalea sp.]